MIKSVTVTNPAGESLKIELGNPGSSGFLVLGIDGIGPSKADVNISDIATMDGSYFTSARIGARNIVLNLKLLGTPTIENTRHLSYLLFPVKKRITLIFETDNRICQIAGYVESNDVNIFSSQETVQISVVCPDPYFYSVFLNIIKFSLNEPNFEFPFENASLTEPLLELGVMSYNTEKTIYYPGDADI